MSFEIYGDVVDADTVEGHVRDTLQSWLVPYLAKQEDRRGLEPRTLPEPRSWPAVSGFDLDAHQQLPAIVIASPGTVGAPVHDRGVYTTVWRIEVAVVLGGRDEQQARMLAALYLAAVKGVLIQNRTLGGNVEKCMWVGPDDHAFGVTEAGSQRAIYGTGFDVSVRNSIDAKAGPTEPPPDPYAPPAAPDYPNESQIIVTATRPEDVP